MKPTMEDLLKHLISDQVGNHESCSPREAVTPDDNPGGMAKLVMRYAQQSPDNIQRLMIPEGCRQFAMTIMVGAAIYRLIEIAEIKTEGDSDGPLRLLHVGADWVDKVRVDESCRAFRTLYPHLPALEHVLIGPEMTAPPEMIEIFDDGSVMLARHFFPGIALGESQVVCHDGSLSDVFEYDQDLARRAHAGHFDAVLFLNPGFIEGNEDSWLECPETHRLLSNPDIRVLGCSQNPQDYYRDKIFLEHFGRGITLAQENLRVPDLPDISGTCWGGLLWVTSAASQCSSPAACLPVSSVDMETALDWLDLIEESDAWQSPEDRANFYPGDWVNASDRYFRITPTISFDVVDGVFLMPSPVDFVEPIQITLSPPPTRSELKKLAEGDYWVRLDFVLDHMEELHEMAARSFGAGLRESLSDLMENVDIEDVFRSFHEAMSRQP